MKLFPTLYTDSSDEIELVDNLFVRVGSKTKILGYGEQWEWQKVVKVLPGVYVAKGKPFFDLKDMFSKVK